MVMLFLCVLHALKYVPMSFRMVSSCTFSGLVTVFLWSFYPGTQVCLKAGVVCLKLPSRPMFVLFLTTHTCASPYARCC